jgi:hypothetical protein
LPLSTLILLGGLLLAAAVLLSALAGGLAAAAALTLGLQLGVRIRQGLPVVPDFRNLGKFLEEHVAGRQARAANLPPQPGGAKAESEEERKAREQALKEAGLRPPVRL